MEYSWIIYALLSAIFAGLVAIFGKIGLKGVDSGTATMIRAFVMFVFLFLVIAYQGKLVGVMDIVSGKKLMLFIVLSGIAGALSWLFYFLALQSGQVAKVASIDRLSIVFAMIFAMVFLNEKVSLRTGLSLLLIVFASVIIATDK
ncbi:MAG: EamA family transporter [Candidatus Pacearchaeota archaeon]